MSKTKMEIDNRERAWQIAGNYFLGRDELPSTIAAALDEAESCGAAKWVEATTPSVETKSAYSGEFEYSAIRVDNDGNEYECTMVVPWTTIKEIMTAISLRARGERP